MAEGRMLKKEISDSGKLGRLTSDRARVLWFMMLPHLDREGRLKADPKIIKGQICTMLPYSIKSIQTALEQLHDIGLIALYQAKGDQCLQYIRFHDFQSFNPDREAKTKIPAPTQENSGVIKRTPLNVRECNVSKCNIKKVKHLAFVFLTSEEHKKLLARYGDNNTRSLIAALNRYIGQSGKEYKSHYYALLNFAKRDDMPELKTPEEKAAQEKKALDKERERIRQENSQFFKEKTAEELEVMRKDKYYLPRWWLIDEILQERKSKG